MREGKDRTDECGEGEVKEKRGRRKNGYELKRAEEEREK